MTLLAVESLGVRFGGVIALDGVNLSVREGGIHGLIGPNGAGKTTLLNCIGRVIEPDTGRIRFRDDDLLRWPAHRLAERGIARTFQNLALMLDRTVLDNVLVGLASRTTLTLSAFVPIASALRREKTERRRALEVLELLGLHAVADRTVGSLPYGQRKSVEIARALCASPRLLMLDEPTAGLHPSEMNQLAQVVRELHRDLSLTIVLITHHLEFLLEVADHVTVLDLGRVIADGPPDLVQTDPLVKQAYLGIQP